MACVPSRRRFCQSALASVAVLVGPSARSPALSLKSIGDEPYYEAVNGRPETLLIHFHSWSGTEAEALATPLYGTIPNCAWLCPRLLGVNNHPGGAWSDDQAERTLRVIAKGVADHAPRRIIAVGGSGGAYLAWMALGTYPGLIHGMSTWVGPHDLAAWWSENPNFRDSLEACLGGPPSRVDYLSRSPKGVLDRARDAIVYINGGQLDDQIAPHHSADAAAQLEGRPGIEVHYDAGANRGHSIDYPSAVAQIATMIAQLA